MQLLKICNSNLCSFVISFDDIITKLSIVSYKSAYYLACKVHTPSADMCLVFKND